MVRVYGTYCTTPSIKVHRNASIHMVGTRIFHKKIVLELEGESGRTFGFFFSNLDSEIEVTEVVLFMLAIILIFFRF
jgi:hypothetical protein